MTTKGSNNPFPSILLNEVATDGSDTPTPVADYRRLFLGEDGELHLIDSSDVVTDVSGAGGDVATDTIWNAAGDLAVGTGSDTAARLGIGASGTVLTSNGTTAAWTAPTAVAARVYNSAVQSIGTGSFTTVTFDSEAFDPSGYHSTSSNTGRFTVPTGLGGIHLVYASGNFATSSSGTQRACRLKVNGTAIIGSEAGFLPTTATSYRQDAFAILSLVATDYVEFEVYQDTGGNLNFGAASTSSKQAVFHIARLGA